MSENQTTIGSVVFGPRWDKPTTDETAIIHMRRVEEQRAKLIEIDEIAGMCRHEMQGRLMDDEHRRAFRALGKIMEIARGR